MHISYKPINAYLRLSKSLRYILRQKLYELKRQELHALKREELQDDKLNLLLLM
jgi:hypothetical protein